MNKILARLSTILVGATIAFAVLFSIRIVVIPTPLNIAEQVGIISMMIEFVVRKTRRKDEDEDSK